MPRPGERGQVRQVGPVRDRLVHGQEAPDHPLPERHAQPSLARPEHARLGALGGRGRPLGRHAGVGPRPRLHERAFPGPGHLQPEAGAQATQRRERARKVLLGRPQGSTEQEVQGDDQGSAGGADRGAQRARVPGALRRPIRGGERAQRRGRSIPRPGAQSAAAHGEGDVAEAQGGRERERQRPAQPATRRDGAAVEARVLPYDRPAQRGRAARAQRL
mmetsp:Transcript_24596/g.66323  ORF Transcript_24596/g.66323 Transcript_24596/m.66323 type:complete len:218 (+) Transcript_24596:763-1416(+)